MNILGPLASTSGDFYQMIWEQGCFVIVMLTDVVEGGTVKCHQYWEGNPGDSVEYGKFSVKTISVDPYEGYLVSLLELKNLKVTHFYDS